MKTRLQGVPSFAKGWGPYTYNIQVQFECFMNDLETFL